MKRKTIALMCGAFLAFAIGHANTSAGVPASAPSRATRAKSQQAKSNGPVSGAARPRPQAPTGTPGAAATSRGDLLPDTAVLARVDDRLIRVHDFNDAYFNSRPLDSRIGAWASPQSEVIASRGVLVANAAKYGAKFLLQPPRPPHWGGYRLKPDNWQFWQGRKSRLHDRLRYTLQDDASWLRERLAP